MHMRVTRGAGFRCIEIALPRGRVGMPSADARVPRSPDCDEECVWPRRYGVAKLEEPTD